MPIVLCGMRSGRDLLIKGAEQAFSCHLPICEKVGSLEKAIEKSSLFSLRLALDVYEASQLLSDVKIPVMRILYLRLVQNAVGPMSERELLREIEVYSLPYGQRVLRVETAMVASVGSLR